jgi:23S rRNA pseudouridine2605 synthase
MKRFSKSDNNVKKDNSGTRINKYIAESGVCSRRKAEEFILDGSVRLNGKLVIDLATLVYPNDKVSINGDMVKETVRYTYIILNKPKDYITTTHDEFGRQTVMDIVHSRARVFPVGRLDRNTTGILLFTNDGELAQRLTHPKYKIERIYKVGLDRPLRAEHAQELSEGIMLDDEKTGKCEIIIDFDDKSKVTILLREGKNREIRRMFEYFDYDVKKLDRKYFATLSTRGLARGEFRHLEKKELAQLRKYVGLL